MTVLQDFKAAIKAGATFEVDDHIFVQLNGKRTVTKVQTQRFAWTLPEDHPSAEATNAKGGSWCDFPKASEVSVDDGWYTIMRSVDWGGGVFFKCRPC